MLILISDNKNEIMPPFIIYRIALTLKELTKKEFLRKEDIKTIFVFILLTIFENSGDTNSGIDLGFNKLGVFANKSDGKIVVNFSLFD